MTLAVAQCCLRSGRRPRQVHPLRRPAALHHAQVNTSNACRRSSLGCVFTPTALWCSWLYVDGTDPKTINPDPWQYNGFEDYNHGTKLKDESCKPMAAYMARLVGHYTAGGHHDDVRTPTAFPSCIHAGSVL